ncbi:MAG: hypothetical protein K2K12_05625 [Clostridia bacterium]|nr:hypothetical protein [Clostridia bacterium]
MKEKKIVLSVILGVSLVALIIALVSGLADSISLMIDGGKIKSLYYEDEKYHCLVGGLEIGLISLGIAFVAVLIFVKGKGKKISTIILAELLTCYFIITTAVLRKVMPIDEFREHSIFAEEYALFVAYLSSAITITVSAILACVSSLLLGRAKKAEEAKQNEQEISVDKTDEA